jgi:hypothetical protein
MATGTESTQRRTLARFEHLRAITKQEMASQTDSDSRQSLGSTQVELIEWFYHHRREKRRDWSLTFGIDIRPASVTA